MIKKVKTKKIKSAYNQYVETLTPKQKQKHEENYIDLVLSELLLAAMHEDDVSVRELAKLAGVSPTIVQGIRSQTRKHVSVQSFFKILNSMGCKFMVERNGQIIPLDISRANKKI
jgi:predicted DNA-binding protein YlxM (UPF0122 family)